MKLDQKETARRPTYPHHRLDVLEDALKVADGVVLGDLLHVVDLAQVHHAFHVLHLGRGVRVELFEEAGVVEADVVAEPRLDRLHLRLRSRHLEDAQTLTEVLASDVAVVVSVNIIREYITSRGCADTDGSVGA